MQPVLIFEESRPSPWTSLSRLQLLTPSGQCGDSWGRGAGGCGGGGVGGQEAGSGGKRRGGGGRGGGRFSEDGGGNQFKEKGCQMGLLSLWNKAKC